MFVTYNFVTLQLQMFFSVYGQDKYINMLIMLTIAYISSVVVLKHTTLK